LYTPGLICSGRLLPPSLKAQVLMSVAPRRDAWSSVSTTLLRSPGLDAMYISQYALNPLE
jgi:hypothetical protein